MMDILDLTPDACDAELRRLLYGLQKWPEKPPYAVASSIAKSKETTRPEKYFTTQAFLALVLKYYGNEWPSMTPTEIIRVQHPLFTKEQIAEIAQSIERCTRSDP